MIEPQVVDILEAQLRMSLKRRKARSALAIGGYETIRSTPRMYLADAASCLRAHVDMNEPMDAALTARITLLVEAAIEMLDEASR